MAAGWVDYWRRGWGWLSSRVTEPIAPKIDQCQEYASQRRRSEIHFDDRMTTFGGEPRRTAFTPEGKRA